MDTADNRKQYTVIGLGNPGERYVHTRHNVGVVATLRAAQRFNVDAWQYESYANARITHGVSCLNDTVTFVLPETYMNRSGDSVRVLCGAHDACGDILVVHDDIDLPEGVVRIVYGRGNGGHNGVRSIEAALGMRTCTRVRIGVLPVVDGVVRKPVGEGAVSAFVLKQCSRETWKRMEEYAERAAHAVQMIIEQGRDTAMQEYNVREKRGRASVEVGDDNATTGAIEN